MCRVSEDGTADVYRSEVGILARKQHRCGECSRTILIGEPYDRHRYLYDGYWTTHLVCSHCAVLGNWLLKECGGTVSGEMIEDIEEHAQEYLRPDLAALAACARVGWVKGPSFRKPYPGIPIPALPPPLQVSEEERRG